MLQIEPFNKEKYVFGYCNGSGILLLKIIDRNKKVLKTASINDFGNSFKFITNNNTIILTHSDNYFGSVLLETFDENLTKLHNFRASYNYVCYSMASTNSNIYFLTSGLGSNNLSIYNLNLQLIDSIGQTSYQNNPFYFPLDIIQLKVKNGKYLWLNPSSFNIVDVKTGIIDKKIEIKANNFMINSKNDLILISFTDKKVFCFDSNGTRLCESNFVNFPDNLVAFIDSNDNIEFFNDQNLLCSYAKTE